MQINESEREEMLSACYRNLFNMLVKDIFSSKCIESTARICILLNTMLKIQQLLLYLNVEEENYRSSEPLCFKMILF